MLSCAKASLKYPASSNRSPRRSLVTARNTIISTSAIIQYVGSSPRRFNTNRASVIIENSIERNIKGSSPCSLLCVSSQRSNCFPSHLLCVVEVVGSDFKSNLLRKSVCGANSCTSCCLCCMTDSSGSVFVNQSSKRWLPSTEVAVFSKRCSECLPVISRSIAKG